MRGRRPAAAAAAAVVHPMSKGNIVNGQSLKRLNLAIPFLPLLYASEQQQHYVNISLACIRYYIFI